MTHLPNQHLTFQITDCSCEKARLSGTLTWDCASFHAIPEQVSFSRLPKLFGRGCLPSQISSYVSSGYTHLD